MLVVTIVQHRTSVLDKTACVCSKTSRVEHTKNVHNRPKPAVFVRTAQGLSSNQNEVAINSKSGLWRTALLDRYNTRLVGLDRQTGNSGVWTQAKFGSQCTVSFQLDCFIIFKYFSLPIFLSFGTILTTNLAAVVCVDVCQCAKCDQFLPARSHFESKP